MDVVALFGGRDREVEKADLVFTKHSRISAGFCHNLVISNAPKTARDEDEADLCDTVWGFGSNRNHVLGMGLPPDDEDEFKDLEDDAHHDKNHFCARSSEHPVPLRFKNKSIAAVCCGGNHSVFLEKRPQQPDGEVWTMGLGTSGRLGVKRPDGPGLEKMIRDNTWMPSEPAEWSASYAQKAREESRRVEPTTIYMKSIPEREPGDKSKWSLRDPVRVMFPGRDKIASIAVGVDHTLAITSSGVIYAWGLGSFGNIGNGTTQDALTPVQVKMPPDTPCVQVVAGMKHSMALTAKSEMYSWGHGGNGRLGQGMNFADKSDQKAYNSSLVPKEVKPPPGAIDLKPMVWIAAGEAHSASIDNLGNVYCWGAGSWGRTGHGEDADVPEPSQVSSLMGIPCTNIELGSLHSIALTDKGSVYGWGSGPATGVLTEAHVQGQKWTPEKVRKFQGYTDTETSEVRIIEIAAGAFHSIALKNSGELYTWGKDQDGRLGLDSLEARSGKTSIWWPQIVRLGHAFGREPLYVNISGSKDIQDEDEEMLEALEDGSADEESRLEVFCGGVSSFAVKGKNGLFVWGSNEHGQLGDSTIKDKDYPSQIFGVDRKLRIAVLACGLEHCVMVMEVGGSDGMENVWTWGRNDHGQLGRSCPDEERLVPKLVPDVRDAVQAAAGEDHSAAILASGELYTWGSAECGKLGVEGPCTPGSMSTLPTRVRMDCKLKKVSCGPEHTAVLSKNGDLYTFGAGWFGRLGHGPVMANYKTPKVVSLFCWDMSRPEETIRCSRVRDVYCASYHTCVVDISGKLWICGRDTEVLNSDHVTYFTLFHTFKEAGVVNKVAVCGQHTFVLTQEGKLWAFGDNTKGQLGIGTITEGKKKKVLERVTAPTEVMCPAWRSSRPQDVVTGVFHSMVLLGNGDVYSMGLKVGGRLGLDDYQMPKEEEYTIDRGRIVPQPQKVTSSWVDEDDEERLRLAALEKDHPQEALEDGPAALADQDDEKEDGEKKEGTPHFQKMQELLRGEIRENPMNTKIELQKKEAELSKKYKGFFDTIIQLWDKPENAVRGFVIRKLPQSSPILSSEWTLRRLQDRLDRSVCTNLQKLNIADQYPNLENNKVHPEVAQRLLFFEELLWLLQQQPCYLANLSQPENFTPATGFHRRQATGEDVILAPGFFTRIVTSLFRPLADDRIRHLYMALIRVAARYEIKHYIKKGTSIAQMKKTLFHPNESTTCLLIRRFVKDPCFKESMQLPLVGEVSNAGSSPGASLIVSVEDWTSEQKEKKKQKVLPAAGIKTDDDQADDALFALELDDLDFLRAAGGIGGLSKKDLEEKKEELKHNLSEHQKTFMLFLDVVDDTTGLSEAFELLGVSEKDEDIAIEAAYLKKVKHKDDLSAERFEKLSRARELLLNPKRRADLDQQRKGEGKNSSRRTFRQFLENHWDMHKDLKAVFVKISNDYNDLVVSKEKKETAYEDEKKEKKKEDHPVLRLFLAGVLGELLEHHESFMTADLDRKMRARCSEALREGNLLFDDKAQAAAALKSVESLKNRVHFNMRNLGKFIRKCATDDWDAAHSSQIIECSRRSKDYYFNKFVRNQLLNESDPTETDLTIDLYKSHFDIDDKFVQINAIDLLELSNALWLFKDRIMLIDKVEEDRLYKLLLKIQPKRKTGAHEDVPQLEKDRIKKTYVSIIAETANEEGLVDGEIVLEEVNRGPGKPVEYRLPGLETPEDTEDFEEAALLHFEKLTGCVLMGSRETRLLEKSPHEDPERKGVYVIRANVSQPSADRMKEKEDYHDKVQVKTKLVLKSVGEKDWLTMNFVRNDLEYQALLKWTQLSNRRGTGWNTLKVLRLERDVSEMQKRFWQKWTLQLIRDAPSQHNFRINHRFLESQRDLCFCRECEAPIPRSISPQSQRGRTELRLIKVFRSNEGEKIEGRYPFAALEEFFASEELELIRKNEYLPAKYELEEQQKEVTKTVQGKPTEFVLASTIERAKKDLEILRNHNIPETRLLDYVSDAVHSRATHADYLRKVDDGLHHIETAIKKHREKVSRLIWQMDWTVQASEDAHIPDILKYQALQVTGRSLTMAGIEKDMMQKKKDRVGEDDPLLYAAAEFPLGFLRSKKVLARVGDTIAKSEYKRLFFNFEHKEGGEWKVKVLHKADGAEHLLMTFDIPLLMLEDMKRTGKTEKKPLGEGDAFIFNCFSLVQLLARVSSNH